MILPHQSYIDRLDPLHFQCRHPALLELVVHSAKDLQTEMGDVRRVEGLVIGVRLSAVVVQEGGEGQVNLREGAVGAGTQGGELEL